MSTEDIGMTCPACQSVDTSVIDSRASRNGIRRRRRCLACQHRFTTYEAIVESDAPDEVVLQLDRISKETSKLMGMLKRRVVP